MARVPVDETVLGRDRPAVEIAIGPYPGDLEPLELASSEDLDDLAGDEG